MTTRCDRRAALLALAGMLPLASTGLCQGVTQPLLSPDGSLIYPEGAAIPRNLTSVERQWLRNNPWGGAGIDAPSPPPTGPVRCVAEYEPMEGLVVSWTGSSAWLTNLAQIGRRVTVEANSRFYVGVTSAAVQTSATNALTAQGANLSNVVFFTAALNSIWARDYGPRYIYEGNVRAIADHRYNRPRPSDDLQPVVFGQLRNHQYYEMGINGITLIHGGGNYHLNATNDAYATQLIVNENPSLTAAQIQQVWNTYQANNTTLTAAFPTTVDATQHIDMWMQIFDDNKVFIGDWPNNAGSTQDVICDNTAALMQSRGYQVTRLPNYLIGGVHYTFTNMVIINNAVLLPQYNSGPGSTVSNQVAAQVQAAFGPGRTVYQINADSIVTAAGVFHCIVQHIPVHKGLAGPNGGLAPTAYLRGPNGGENLQPGQQFNIQWISDDDGATSATGVQRVDLQLSTDGGATFPMTIASNQPALGSFNWTVPAGINSATARVRAVATDAAGNTGSDGSNANFTIGTPQTCYANCDGSTIVPVLNALDFSCFLGRYVAGDAYANCDGSTIVPVLNALDFSCFLGQYVAGCP